MKRLISLFLAALILLSGCSRYTYQTDRFEDYDKGFIAESYRGDLDSDLTLFPANPASIATDASYYAILKSGLFDTDAEIILDCSYEPARFDEELERLAGIYKIIRHGDKEHTNLVMYDDKSYNFPAYITIDGFGNTFEYALIDRKNTEIIYIYLAYPDVDKFKHPEYLKKDLSLYDEKETQNAFSIYNHSFDNGASWTEFSD